MTRSSRTGMKTVEIQICNLPRSAPFPHLCTREFKTVLGWGKGAEGGSWRVKNGNGAYPMDAIVRYCGATTHATGAACRRVLGPGQTRCHIHGGATPLARQATAERLAAAAFPAAAVLYDIVDAWRRETCPTCGFPTGDAAPVIRAAVAVLDRTGFHPSATIEVKTTKTRDNSDEDVHYLTPSEMERMESALLLCVELREQAKQRRLAGVALPVLDVVAEDGVLIPDEGPIPSAEVAIPTGNSTPSEGPSEVSDVE